MNDYDDLTPRERHARRLLTIAALEKWLEQEKAAARAEAVQPGGFTIPGQREVVLLPDGATLGNVRVDKTAGGWVVKDKRLLLEWTRQNAPVHVLQRITEEVTPAFVRQLIEQAEQDGDGVLSPITGELFDPTAVGLGLVEPGTRVVTTADPETAVPAAQRMMAGGMLALGWTPEEP